MSFRGTLSRLFRRRRARVAGVASLAIVGGLVVLPLLPAEAAPVLPSGFVLRDIPTGLAPPSETGPGDLLTDFAYLPDSSLLVIGKLGKMAWVSPSGTPRHIADLPTNARGDIGLVGLAVAPDYQTSRTVYTGRTVPSTGAGSGAYGLLRLSRWTIRTDAAGDPVGLDDELTLVETSADSNVHGATGVVAAPDGTVWASFGDSADWRNTDPLALRALDTSDGHGKLFHVRPDGTGVPANPYYDPANPQSIRSKVYASGFRSPFRFSLHPATGQPVLADVGSGYWEEIDLVRPGNSYGWPCWEANSRTVGYRDLPQCAGVSTTSPIWAYPHSGAGASITGGLVYTGTSYPEAYRGRYFFGDYVRERLWTMAFNEQGQVTTAPETNGFGNEIGAPVKFGTVPAGGDIVYADINSGKLRRLVYAPGNAAPNAAVSSTTDPVTRAVSFDAGGSSDPNGDALTYQWDFGDGSSGSGAQVSHTYPASPESFTVTLTVTDPLGATGSETVTVWPANHGPALTVGEPEPSRTYAVGDVVTASAQATDPEDGALPVRWSTVVVHCYTASDCHDHPGEQQSGGQFEMTFTGHPGDSRLKVTASAVDSRGATAVRSFLVNPKQRRVTIQSNYPADFTIGDEQTSSGLFTVGTPLSLIAPEAAYDVVATFDRWGDGGTDRVRNLTVPDADTTITATYLTPIDRRYATDTTLKARVGTPVNVEQGDSMVRWREYTTGRVYWSPTAGVHYVVGPVTAAYLRVGGHIRCGVPTTDEVATVDGIGAYNHFAAGCSVFWSPDTGAYQLAGAIRTLWGGLGWERSRLGYPTSDERMTAERTGSFNHFQRGSIFWSRTSNAHFVSGAIRTKWSQLGWERSRLGYPTSDERMTAERTGSFNHFQRGSIFWSRTTGAHFVSGSIRTRWSQLGWERSYLGYPTSDEYAVSGGARSNFQHGYIVWSRSTGQTTAYRY
ncbi:MAG: PQQ-dependent sugar dehydrogenase [Micromonosporaceae bacterium]